MLMKIERNDGLMKRKERKTDPEIHTSFSIPNHVYRYCNPLGIITNMNSYYLCNLLRRRWCNQYPPIFGIQTRNANNTGNIPR